LRVAYLGPEGSFTEEALRASAPEGAEPVPYGSIHETVMAVQGGETDLALVPIENALEGSVSATLDLLAGEAHGVRIAREVVLPVHHCLIAQVPLERVERVLSHPQAFAQCARFLRERLPAAERQPVASTSEAVRIVAAGGEPWAAIGSRAAAEVHGGRVVEADIEDHPDNETRFVWLGPAGSEPLGKPDKTSIVFWGFNDVSAGALVDVLAELSTRGINLTKIESRPRRMALGHYMFFADLEGAADEAHVSEALAALGGRVDTLKVLGSYPAGAGPSPR
jgi:prephenate dehydratase